MNCLLRLEPFDRLLIRGIFAFPAFFVLCIRGCIAFQVPRVVHYQGEVIIVVDRHGNILVVLNELVNGDAAIRLGAISNVMVGLKGLKELNQHLVLGLLAARDVWVLVRAVLIPDVVDVKHS